jgi:hypothetical protein
MILKGSAAPDPGMSPSGVDWPAREMELYRSGLLSDLHSSLRVPACYGDFERPDASTWIWLEDIAFEDTGPWPVDRYRLVARELGRFNGASLANGHLPNVPSISRGWLQQWIEESGPWLARLEDHSDAPLIREIYPADVIDAFRQDWDNRSATYALLGRSPQAFCHLDAFLQNLLFPRESASDQRIVLIDWAYAGIAAIGEELAALTTVNIMVGDHDLSDAPLIEAAALEGYLEGLRDTGWEGDPQTVQAVYEAASRLRYGLGLLRNQMRILLDPERLRSEEERHGASFAAFAAPYGEFHRWLVTKRSVK